MSRKPKKVSLPYTPNQVVANLQNCERELAKFKSNLKGGPGYVRTIIKSILAKGISC